MSFPEWLRKPAPEQRALETMEALLNGHKLNTVCREANCPNVGECFGERTATFMIMGSVCTRNCPFCNVQDGAPQELDPDEPLHVAQAAAQLGLRHVVVTSVTRDDLDDGGAGHFAATVRAIREEQVGSTVEVLIPDFQGNRAALEHVLAQEPEVVAHNVETVASLYPQVRPRANYHRSLAVLSTIAGLAPRLVIKSGLMLGLGETEEEIHRTLEELRHAGVNVVTLGQYLRPSPAHLPVQDFVSPERFEFWKERAREVGFEYVASGPFVRSSYRAAEAMAALTTVGKRGLRR